MKNLLDEIIIPAHVHEILTENDMPMHSHPSIEMLYIKEGIAEFSYLEANEIRKISILPKQFILIAPLTPHCWKSGNIHDIVLEFTSTNNDDILHVLKNSAFYKGIDNDLTLIKSFHSVLLFNDTEDVEQNMQKILLLIKKMHEDGKTDFLAIGYDIYLKTLC